MDFEGRSEGRSIKSILAHVAPLKLVLVHGSAEATEHLKEHCSKHVCPHVYAPQIEETIDVTSDLCAYKVQLSERLMSNVLFKKLGDYEISWIDAEVGKTNDMLTLFPVSSTPPTHKSVLVGDLKLADFKQFLASKGIQATLFHSWFSLPQSRTIFYGIYKRKSTEGFHSVRYVIAHFSCMLWVYYAYIKTDEILHITNNAFGLLVESVYIVIYLIYAPLRAKKLTAAIVIFLNVTIFGVIVAITLLLFHGQKRLNILGWICVGFSVIFFAAPLSIMRLVIRTKNVEFMPFNLSILETISAAVWLGYGLMSKDIYVALTNIVGLLFGIAKMVLDLLYLQRCQAGKQ